MSLFLKSRYTLAISCLTLPILAGCSYANVEDVRHLTSGGDTFADALSTEYRQFALFESDQMADWIDADHFAAKSLDAARGHAGRPERVEDWNIDDNKIAEFTLARERLMAFRQAGAGDMVPAQLAMAQVNFDCWLEQQEENWQTDHIALCRDTFYGAIGDIEPEILPVTTVHFNLDSGVMDAEGRRVLKYFASHVASFETGAIVIDGHADRAGSSPYNLALSQKRAKTVRHELIKAGIAPGRITITAYGESSPVVTTPDGTVEPLNRRAEVQLRLPPLYATIAPETEVAGVRD
jgi:OmpA-OmpF porin, OOP family